MSLTRLCAILVKSNVELCGAPRAHRLNGYGGSRRVRTNAKLELMAHYR